MRTVSLHEKDIILNKEKLKEYLDNRGMGYIELHERVSSSFGLDLTYKGFMSLLDNRSTWKLLYAYAIVTSLKLNIDDVFELIDIDVKEKVKEKEAWKNKYQNKSKKRGKK